MFRRTSSVSFGDPVDAKKTAKMVVKKVEVHWSEQTSNITKLLGTQKRHWLDSSDKKKKSRKRGRAYCCCKGASSAHTLETVDRQRRSAPNHAAE